MAIVTIAPRGPFSLAASSRFLEGFTPASYDAAPDDVLRLAFPLDDGHATAGAAVRQSPDGDVEVDVTGTADARAVGAQVARILSLDVDGSGLYDAVATDAVATGLVARHAGLRPVCFHSPYEAAAWAVIGHRIRMTQAARIKAAIAREHGTSVIVAGRPVDAFPASAELRKLDAIPGLSALKLDRLHAVADAALAGELDAARLRAMPVDEALDRLEELPGIGPFSAELILIRGAAHPDVFPTHERRLHRAMAAAYGVDASDVAELAGIAAGWAPYRSWIALLFRAETERQAPPGCHGRSRGIQARTCRRYSS